MIKTAQKVFSLAYSLAKEECIFLAFQNLVIFIVLVVQGYSLFKINSFLKIEEDYDISKNLFLYGFLYVFSTIVYIILIKKNINSINKIYNIILINNFKSYIDDSYQNIIKQDSARLLSKYTTDSLRLLLNVFYPISLIVSSVILVFVYGLFLLAINYKITIIISIIGFLIYLFLVLVLKNKLRKNSEIISGASDSISGVLGSLLNGSLEVKFYRLESKKTNIFALAFDRFSSSIGSNALIVQYPKFIVDLSIFLLIALFFLFKKSTPLSINAGEIAIFIVAGTRILPAIQIIYNALTAVSGNLDLISSFNNPDNSLEKKIKCATQKNVSNIAFQNSYILKINKNNNLDPKFSGLNIGEITFRSGKNYIIHGKSGIGKSSLFLYLANLIDSDSINITLDGADNCREAIANNILLSIDSDLFFSGSVLDNINDFMSKDMNGISIKEALEISGCEFLSVASNISDNAKNLSTGQRQRLSLARVLAFDKRPILLIDESLSGLPPHEERIIYHKLFNLFKSVIVISHRTDNDDIFDFTYTF